jgi:hypothetical protein
MKVYLPRANGICFMLRHFRFSAIDYVAATSMIARANREAEPPAAIVDDDGDMIGDFRMTPPSDRSWHRRISTSAKRATGAKGRLMSPHRDT